MSTVVTQRSASPPSVHTQSVRNSPRQSDPQVQCTARRGGSSSGTNGRLRALHRRVHAQLHRRMRSGSSGHPRFDSPVRISIGCCGISANLKPRQLDVDYSWTTLSRRWAMQPNQARMHLLPFAGWSSLHIPVSCLLLAAVPHYAHADTVSASHPTARSRWELPL